MDDRSHAPYIPQDPQAVAQVIGALNTHFRKGKTRDGFSVRKKTYAISDGSGRTVDSWQMQDWDYKKPGLPTYARGFFSHSNNGRPEIAVRGYDKFFNTDEVNETAWHNIEHNTRGPYELSVKENGCIIFIAGLDDHTLLVTSKHSTGARQDASANHAFAGEAWIDRHLASQGKTRADLAQHLRSMNATAVAELCDDQFEEHVLEYNPDMSGLYLHGINLNLPEFATYPGNLVADFAEEWGFKKTMFIMKDSIHEVKTFLEDVAQTGNYAGRDTEGFVIRCQARQDPAARYHDWFFKYKFEEPYLMYRQWREVTKAVIAGKAPKIRKHKQITEEYIFYARSQLAKDPSLGKAFNQNHGIIKMRNGFLEQKGMRGDEIIRREQEAGRESSVSHDIVLCPVATIGCGKTTCALALVKLFGWGHEQNDNIVGKGKRPQKFAQAVTTSLAAHPVVIADRNNHQRRERDQIIRDVSAVAPNAQFVALHWVHDRGNYDEIRQIMQARVLKRGDNHQTIQAVTKGSGEVVSIMDGFMGRFEPVDVDKEPDDGFNHVIDLDVTVDSRQNLETIVSSLHEEYPKLFQMPSDEQMDEAIEWALNYQPDIKHDLGRGAGGHQSKKEQKQAAKQHANGSAKLPRHEFFCLSIPGGRIAAILEAVFNDVLPEQQRFYKQLKASRRIQPSFHVTLIHKASATEHPAYWDRLVHEWQVRFDESKEKQGYDPAPSLVELARARIQLEYVVWDERVMGILVRLLDAGHDQGYSTVNRYAHITIGTASDAIKPKETNDLLTAWHEGGNAHIQDVKVKGNVVLEGGVKAVMSR